MSTYSKMKKRRDCWRTKTGEANAKVHYLTRELKRVKREREQYKKDAYDARKELAQRQQIMQPVIDKTTLVFIALQLFLVARIGFRAIARVLAVCASPLGLVKAPCPQTIINWVMRLTIVRMTGDLTHVQPGGSLFAGGCILLIDSSIALGQGKILTVLALDARHYAHQQDAPTLQQVICVAVAVADTWTGETIAHLLQQVIKQIGSPIAYLKDGGSDLGKAVRLVSEPDAPNVSIDDISHVIANLLKRVFESHPLFAVFLQACGAVSKRFKQTILACLAPPKVSTKARFMNLHRLVKWAKLILQQSPRGRAAHGSLLQRLRENLEQLPRCRRFIHDFLLNTAPLIECQKILKTQGLSKQSVAQCRPLVATIPHPTIRIDFMSWLDRHLAIAHTLELDEIGLPISSDSIESLFGVAKHHGTGELKDANRIALRIPALCGKLTRQDAEQVLSVPITEQQRIAGSLPSLTKQRRTVLNNGGALETIKANAAQPSIVLIAGSKSPQKSSYPIDNTLCLANGGDP